MNSFELSVNAMSIKKRVIYIVMKKTGASYHAIEEAFSQTIEWIMRNNATHDGQHPVTAYMVIAVYRRHKDNMHQNRLSLIIDDEEKHYVPSDRSFSDMPETAGEILDRLISETSLNENEKNKLEWLRLGAQVTDMGGWNNIRRKLENTASRLGYKDIKPRVRKGKQMRRDVWPDDEHFIKLRSGHSLSELAKMFGVSLQCISRRETDIRKKYELDARRRRWTDSEREQLKPMIEPYMTIEKYKKIGEQINRSWKSVKEEIRKLKKVEQAKEIK